MSTPNPTRILYAMAALALAGAVSAQSAGTAGPANPKEVGKPGTSANKGASSDGALNASDSRAASGAASSPMRSKKQRAMKPSKRASGPNAGASSP